MAGSNATRLLSDELFDLLSGNLPVGGVINTLAQKRPNWIERVAREGVYVETEKSRREGRDAELVPAWMLQRAWDHLREHGTLTNMFLVATSGLNVKRSAAVSAMLAQLPGVIVLSDRPIELQLAT